MLTQTDNPSGKCIELSSEHHEDAHINMHWPENNEGCILVGSPRSGTFLLMAILEECFDIAAPLETHFIPYFERYRFLWGDLTYVKNRRKMLSAIFDFLDIWTPRMMVKGDLPLAWKYSLSSVRPYSEQIIEQSITYGDLVVNMFRVYQEIQKKSGWVDKSAYFRHVDIDLVCKSIPDAKVIHLIRDGRDVVLSWMKTWATPTSMEEGAFLWNEHVTKKSAWGVLHPERYLEIRYEDLLCDTKKVLTDIGEFLGRNPKTLEPNLGRSQYARALSELDSHKLVAGSIRAENGKKFLLEYNSSQISSFENIAGEALIRFGYELNGSSTSKRILSSGLIKLRGIFSMNHMRRLIKANLPMFIRLSQLLRIDIVHIINHGKRLASWPRTGNTR